MLTVSEKRSSQAFVQICVASLTLTALTITICSANTERAHLPQPSTQKCIDLNKKLTENLNALNATRSLERTIFNNVTGSERNWANQLFREHKLEQRIQRIQKSQQNYRCRH
jgi:hypothetical protein